MSQLEGMCCQWIVFDSVFYCLDDFNLSAEEVSFILDTSSDNDGNVIQILSHLCSNYFIARFRGDIWILW